MAGLPPGAAIITAWPGGSPPRRQRRKAARRIVHTNDDLAVSRLRRGRGERAGCHLRSTSWRPGRLSVWLTAPAAGQGDPARISGTFGLPAVVAGGQVCAAR
jgi:hypothetical protein